MPVRMTPINRFQPWVPVACLIILAAFVLACAGGKGASDSAYAEVDLPGRTLLIPSIDTSVVAIDPIGDVVDGLPSDGRLFAPQALLAGRFRTYVTGARGIAPETWGKAFDDAARQVAKIVP